jgi:diguanylate cyclase (GGDEF)-like protein
MRTQLKTTKVLIIDSILIIVLIATFVSVNIFLTGQLNKKIRTIDKQLEKKLNITMRMANIIRERSTIMLNMYTETDAWKIDDDFQHFHRIALDFIKLRTQFEKFGLSEQEKETFGKALQLIKKTEPIQNDIVDKIQSGYLETVGSDISRKDIPLEIELLGVIENLSRQIIRTSFETRIDAQNVFSTTITSIAIVSIFIVFGLIILMRRSLRKIQKIEMALLLETENLSWDATHDHLTNIYNRKWLSHKIEKILETKPLDEYVHSLLYMDLDGFKAINDKYGHVAGDQYLYAICRKIEKCIRQNDIFARIGGDEFAILLENCEPEKSLSIAEQILDTINHFTYDYEGNNLKAGCSIGVYRFTQSDGPFDKIIKHADTLCYKSKESGRNRITTN